MPSLFIINKDARVFGYFCCFLKSKSFEKKIKNTHTSSLNVLNLVVSILPNPRRLSWLEFFRRLAESKIEGVLSEAHALDLANIFSNFILKRIYQLP